MIITDQITSLKVGLHEIFPKIEKVTCPPWLHPVKIWLQTVSRKWRNQEILKLFIRPAQTFVNISQLTVRGISKECPSSPPLPISSQSSPRSPDDWAHHLLGPDDWAQSVSRLGPASWTIGPTPSRLGPPDLFWLCYLFIFPAIKV